MDKLSLTIIKWSNCKVTAECSRQNQIMGGATKKDISAMDAYLEIIDKFIKDLYELKK